MDISVSGRKRMGLSIQPHLDFVRTHARIEGGLNFTYNDIDAVWGSVEGNVSPMYGGRVTNGVDLFSEDVYWLYDKGIGVKIPLSTVFFTEELYNDTKKLLKEYHRENNIILVSTEKFAERIRQDFPLYKIEMSAVKDIYSSNRLDNINRGLFDTIVLPIRVNDDLDMLNDIDDKQQIRLFLNVECSYTCPNKICYTSISKINQGIPSEEMRCSKYFLKQPRLLHEEELNWDLFNPNSQTNREPQDKDNHLDWKMLYFKQSIYEGMGFNKFKLVVPNSEAQRVSILMSKD
jgi:hypothetical protein